jgi:eukaryotic-like serine/threonine-protein kinase
VAGYYAAAAEIPVPDAPPVSDAVRPAADARQAAPEVPQPAPEIPQPVPDDSWPEPGVRPAGDQLVDSHQEPPVGADSASMFAEPPSPPSIAEVGPLAGAVATAASGVVADQSGGHWREASSPARMSSPRPLLGIHVEEDTLEPVAAPSGARTRMLVGIGAAAVLIVALGGYALVRPSSVGATATRRTPPAPPPSAAAANTASLAPAPSAASAAPADTRQTPSAPRTPEAPPPAAAPERLATTGTVEVVSPVSLRVSEGGRALGSSGEPIQLLAGRHTLDIGREDLGYQAVQVVDVKPGRSQRVEPLLPTGVANLNATPWAEVWIDGRKVGETPLGRLQLTIGPHYIQFRHPELGDQTRSLVVTAGSVALLSVDLRK